MNEIGNTPHGESLKKALLDAGHLESDANWMIQLYARTPRHMVADAELKIIAACSFACEEWQQKPLEEKIKSVIQIKPQAVRKAMRDFKKRFR